MEENEESEEVIYVEKREKYFFDSYAIIEILKENPSYEKYKDEKVIIAFNNLAEIYYHCINDSKLINESDKIFDIFNKTVVEIDDEALKEAMKFRKENKKKDVSYADCIGYIYAKRHELKFLTGDKEFEKMPNVEFVK
jgi:predicted nucleic acid-binding protein